MKNAKIAYEFQINYIVKRTKITILGKKIEFKLLFRSKLPANLLSLSKFADFNVRYISLAITNKLVDNHTHTYRKKLSFINI